MKNLKPILFILAVLILTAATIYPQRKFGGRVVEVIDGKTCVIEVPGGRITAVLQYIEVPEPEQMLRQTVKQHLEGLVLNKAVEFNPRVVMWDRTVGQLMVGGVDVSQQMLRDGAAWHVEPEDSGQEFNESTVYRDNQSQASNEKRGVWGVPNMKPSWEFRAEKAALAAKEERERYEKARLQATLNGRSAGNTPRSTPLFPRSSGDDDLFTDVFDENKYDTKTGFGSLRQVYYAERGEGRLLTPTIFLDFPKLDLFTKLNSRLYFAYRGTLNNIQQSYYMVALVGMSNKAKFSKATKFAVNADGKRLDFGNGLYYKFVRGDVVAELLLYKVTTAQLQKMAKARTLKPQVDQLTGTIAPESYELIRNLYNVTTN